MQCFVIKQVGTEEIKLRLKMPTHEFMKLMEQRGRIFELRRLGCSPVDEDGLRDVVVDLVPDNGICLVQESAVDNSESKGVE